MRYDRVILGLAVVCVLLTLRCPARAADSLHQLDLGGAGLTTTDLMVVTCDANTVIAYDRGATSPTNAGRKMVYSGGWSVSTFSGPVPTAYGNASAFGCVGSTIILGGGDLSANGSDWLYTSDVSDPGSWTESLDTIHSGQNQWHFGDVVSTLGSKTYTSGVLWQDGAATDSVNVCNVDVSPWSIGSCVNYSPGVNKFGGECSGAKGASNHYGAACWGPTNFSALGFTGSGTAYSNTTIGGTMCAALTGGTIIARQSFGVPSGSDSIVFHLAYQGTNSAVCGIFTNGSAGFITAKQTFSSLSIVGGAQFAGSDRVWSAGGTAYVGGGSPNTAYFSDESGTTYDLPCDSGVLSIVVAGVDVDQDADATDNLLGICTSGDAVYFGEALPESGGLSPIILLDDETEFP